MNKADMFEGVEEQLAKKTLEELVEGLEWWTSQVRVELNAGRLPAVCSRATMAEKVAREIRSRTEEK
jgi:hypothetical protein